MKRLTLTFDEAKINLVEKAAMTENKPVAVWLEEHVLLEARRVLEFAAATETARANGYPEGWINTLGCLADDKSFAGPARGPGRNAPSL